MAVDPWKRIEPTSNAKVGYKTVVLKTFVMPSGEVRSYATIGTESERAGAVIALTKENKVIVGRQFRPGPQKIMLEIPGGGIEAGEDPQVGAMRELEEESGYTSKKVGLLGTYSGNAYSNTTWYYYIAYDCELTPRGQQLDDTEYIDVILLSIEEFIQQAKADMVTDTTAVLLAYDTLRGLQS